MCQLCANSHDRLSGRSGTEDESTWYQPNPIALLRLLSWHTLALAGSVIHVGNLASWLNVTDKTRESAATNRPTQPFHPIHDPARCMLGGAALTPVLFGLYNTHAGWLVGWLVWVV